MEQYTCTKGKDGRIYVFSINKQGKKHRVKNIYADKCKKKQLIKCKKLCKNNKISQKANPPCKKRSTVFVDKKDINSYCQSKIKGSYDRRNRQKIAEQANKLMKKEIINKSTKKKQIKFLV
jgi:hypothetical protein